MTAELQGTSWWTGAYGWVLPVASHCIKNCHTFSSLNSTHSQSPGFCGSGVQTWLGRVLYPGFTRLQSRCRSGHVLIRRLNWRRICFQTHSSCRQNSFPCDCVTEAVTLKGRTLASPGGCPQLPAKRVSSTQLPTSSGQQVSPALAG